MQEPKGNIVFRNLANVVSLLGVLPICILFLDDGYQYLIPLIVYNNIMDDLDGVLAAKLNIKSPFGALLDNVCDAIAHTVMVMVVGTHLAQEAGHLYAAGFCLAGALLASVAIVVRVVTRLSPTPATGRGSPTNELIRHILFILLMERLLHFDPTPVLIVAFVLHSASMVAPFRMPYLIRSQTESAIAIGLVNVAILVAWLVPYTVPVIAASFVGSYLCSFVAGGIGWVSLRRNG